MAAAGKARTPLSGWEGQGDSAVPQSECQSPSPGHSAAAAALHRGGTCKEVQVCSFVKFPGLLVAAVGTATFLWSISEELLWSEPQALLSANGTSGSWWLCLCGVAGAKSCAFSLLQSSRNIELRNGIVQGHAYTVTGAVKVRPGTCSCLQILY